ncbi:MAG: hypothetical protein P1V13_23210 [Rhizobiaceae bacterium]|nr:hypothetical protein [Rhizobiaceae bacterium]
MQKTFYQCITAAKLARTSMTTAFAMLLLGAFAGAAQSNESSYTKIDFDKCVTLSADSMGARLVCPGFGGYGVFFKEDDLRQAVQFGHVDQGEVFESFGAFNRINETVEWRINVSGVPIATILRWFLENPDPDSGISTPQYLGQVLVISRVGQPGDARACVVGYVDALGNKDANVLAREVADNVAADFACGAEAPAFYGFRTELASEPARSIP